jgi:transcriptional regulator with XRE-family HTH domain
MSNIIKSLREKNGYSQEDLAKLLGITRQTLTKYENGSVEFSLGVIKKLSEIFEISYDCIIDNKLKKEPIYNIVPSNYEAKEQNRINIPQKNIDKFKEVLLYMLNKIGAKPNVGQAVIYKLLYFIDFDYYELYEEQLIGAEYIKNKYGPTPIDFIKIIDEMKKNNELQEVTVKYFNLKQTKYLPNIPERLNYLTAKEIKHIDCILKKYSDKSAKELSDISHKDIPWIAANEGEIIDYESVFYRTPETSVRIYDDPI